MTKDLLKAQYLRAKAVDYAWAWIGTPYVWGGDDFSGFDCSGLVIEILKGVGLLPHNYDTTANGLYIRYASKAVEKGSAGCLVFWFNSKMVAKHVEMMIDDLHTIGASGGGSSTKTIADAIAQNAFIKMRPFWYRGDIFKIVDPFKEL